MSNNLPRCFRDIEGKTAREWESGFFVNVFPSNGKERLFSGLCIRSKLDAFWSASWSAEVWAETRGEMTVT